MSKLRFEECRKEILYKLRDKAERVKSIGLLERLINSEWTPFLLGGAAGAV